jgi:hypothetical protein
MAHESYRGYLILSRPEPAGSDWRPYFRITWEDQSGLHSYELLDTGILFNTEDAATAYGFALARSWIDREL